jgi:cyclopropane fatty-acyl-phospholipid synthase-like methyltransferase
MFRKFIASRFKKPTGLVGIWASNLMVKGNKSNYDKLIEGLDLQPHEKLLEIGYGPGTGINTIAQRCPSCIIHGIDFSPLMYKRASKYNKTYLERGTMRLHYGDFLKMTSTDHDYDKVFCLNVVYFWNELRPPFGRVYSLLKEGGSFHIYMADKNALIKQRAPDSVFNKYSLEDIVEALKSSGFENVEHYSEKGHYIKAIK